MIWHFVEVWLMVVLTFVVGCLAGAHLYGFIGNTRLAPAQGAVADFIGDGIDRLKARFGLAPTWRPAHLRQIDRPVPPVPVAEAEAEADLAPVAVPVADELLTAEEPARSPTVAVSTPSGNRLRRGRGRPPVGVVVGSQPLPARLPMPPVPAVVPVRPPGIASPRGGVPDNLQRIKGIGKRNERLLNELGVFHFGQIAAWTPAEIEWIGDYLAFPERIARDDWIGQAMLLAMGSETGFQKSSERRRERRRQQRDFQERMATASVAYVEMEGEDQESEDEESEFVDEGDDGFDRVDDNRGDDPGSERYSETIDEVPAIDDVGLDEPLTGDHPGDRDEQDR